MVELKKLSRITDSDNPKKIEKTLVQRFNLPVDKKPIGSYSHKIEKLQKLKLHNNSISKNITTGNVIVKENATLNNSDFNYPSIETISPKEYIENALRLEIEKKRLEIISSKLHDTEERITSSHLDNVVEKETQNVDFLLDALVKKTGKVEEEQPFIETISFLDNKPKIEKITIKDTGVSHLYAKLDAIESRAANLQKIKREESQNTKESTSESKPIYALLEEIEIPEIYSIKDDTNLSEAVTKGFSTNEHTPQSKKTIESNFVLDNGKVNANKTIDNNITNYKNNLKKSKTEKPEFGYDKIIEDIIFPDIVAKTPRFEPNQKPKTAFDYILPKDSDRENSSQITSKANSDLYIENPCGKITNSKELIYSIKPKTSDIDKINISEKYNIDEFTFVNINYMMSQGLVYSVIQPTLNDSQEEIYLEIKKIFLDSIDSNYMSFKGDKQNINNYIKKIFDLTVDKLSYNLTDLEKKLYFNFIKRDFSGFGFLSTILEDKNIIEISCSGENMPLIVYHLKYGGLETNLKFDNLFKLNQFVLSLTKVMGLQVNSAQPIINGYLPNGYKVEGLYSVGDISNKGSSFIIKKYLEEPLTPVSLINLGIGISDLYSYIWTAMDDGYQVIITGGDAYLFISALAQFYPDKTITSIQSFDYIKLPQKNWIKKLLLDNLISNKKIIISQVLSQRSDYLILDNFTEDLFETRWYEFSMVYLTEDLLPKYFEKAKAINRKLIVINLERTKISNIEQMQITNIFEVSNGQKQNVISYSKSDSEFNINLVSSNINIVEYSNHKKLLRWLIDSDITDSTDFNNIVNDYYNHKEQLLRKLNILE